MRITLANLGTALLVLAVLAFWLLGAYNRLMRLRAAIGGTFAALEIQLRKRQALLRHLGASMLPEAAASGGAQPGGPPRVQVPFDPDEDDEDLGGAGFAHSEPPPTQPAVLDDEARDHAARALTASEAARAATERLHKRAVVPSLMGEVQAREQALEQSMGALSEALRLSALESPLPRPQAELLDRLRRLHTPIAVSSAAYNQAVAAYNEALGIFPTSLAAWVFRFAPALPLTLQGQGATSPPNPPSPPTSTDASRTPPP